MSNAHLGLSLRLLMLVYEAVPIDEGGLDVISEAGLPSFHR
jgi:hypothetical protein